MASVTDRELQRAWEAVPNYAIVQIRNSQNLDALTLWWRCDDKGKVFHDAGGLHCVRGYDGRLISSWWPWRTENREVIDFVIVARDITPDTTDEEIRRRCGLSEVSRVA